MFYCTMCHKPIWTMYQSNSTVPMQFGDAYCQCATITVRLNDYCFEVLKSLSRQLQPTPPKTPVPPMIYDAFTDEEVSL